MQLVNLYEPGLGAGRSLAPEFMLRALAWCAVVLLAAGAYLALERVFATRMLASAQAALEGRQVEVARLTQALAEHLDRTRYEGRANALERERVAKLGLLAELQGSALGRAASFAPELRTLSESRVEGLWLTRFGFAAGGAERVLEGRSFDPAGIPELLERIGESPTFAGVEFRTVELERGPDDDAASFRMRTHIQEPAP